MKIAEANKLAPGIYQLWWRGGGWSVAAVGLLGSGARWFSPCNWTAGSPSDITSRNWRMVLRVDRLSIWKGAD